ncbi:hypothetical protein FQR65_LT08119 [Abscondita terminalis]|nr:hypothetical protein FQR65_LT08119 [Abscondita terminalis]
MFTYVVVILISITLRSANASKHEPYISKYVNEKCFSFLGNKTRQLQSKNIYECVVSHRELKTGEDYYKFYCENKRATHCVEITVPFYVDCLNSEEQYISNFLTSSVQEVITHMCSKEKAHFLNAMESFEKVECVSNGTLSDVTVKCFDTVFKKDEESEYLLSQSFVCGELSEFKICLEEVVQINCKNNLLRDVLRDVFYPFVNWCKTN